MDLAKVDQPVRAFAKRRRLKVESKEIGAPGLTLTWKKDGILRMIRVTGEPRYRMMVMSNAVDSDFKRSFSTC